jgi:hypothetical protein
MPNGEEESTGFVIDHAGHIFAWWIQWDREANAPAFIEWETIRKQPHWLNSSEYLEARRRAGLENN